MPELPEIFFTDDLESFIHCPECGLAFSGKYGADQRRENRVKGETPLVLNYQGQNYKGITFDSSSKGLGLKIFRSPPLADRGVLNLTLGEESLRANVIWSKNFSGYSLAGVERLN
jgi:hypothetical protein